jgi:hypothetical protein
MTCNTCNKEKSTDDMMGRDICKDCWNKKKIDFVYYNPEDFEVTGDTTGATKMFLDNVKGMRIK